jgi:hypothetical protein
MSVSLSSHPTTCQPPPTPSPVWTLVPAIAVDLSVRNFVWQNHVICRLCDCLPSFSITVFLVVTRVLNSEHCTCQAGAHSTTWATPPALFVLVFFQKESCAFCLASLRLQAFYPCLSHRYESLCLTFFLRAGLTVCPGWFWIFYVAVSVLELSLLLHLPPTCWDCRCEPPHLAT